MLWTLIIIFQNGDLFYIIGLVKVSRRLMEDQNYLPEVDKALCIHCNKCLEACEFNVLAVGGDGDIEVVAEEQCIGCGKCGEVCPVGAIWID